MARAKEWEQAYMGVPNLLLVVLQDIVGGLRLGRPVPELDLPGI